MQKAIYLLILCCLALFSCNKGQPIAPSLPPATRNGSETLGAKIDETTWLPFSCAVCINSIKLSAGLKQGTLTIVADSSTTSVTSEIELQLINVSSTGTYTLGPIGIIPIDYTNHAEINYYRPGLNGKTSYYSDVNHTGTVTITNLDLQKNIVSGTFSFDAANSGDPSDVKHVTSGRFDVVYIAN